MATGEDILNHYEYDARGNLTLCKEKVENRLNLLILMTQNNVVYCFMDRCVLEGSTCVKEMPDCLVGECKMPRFIY